MGERENKKRRTRRDLADAAVRLFTEHGYEHVTMADVAAAAGVSRRTAFRYFPAKHDLVMEYPDAWLRVFDHSIGVNQNLAVSERIRAASYDVATSIESDPDAVRQLFALAFAHPALTARYAASNQQWVERLAAEIERDPPPGVDSAGDAHMLAAATMGIINSVCEIWAKTDQPMRPLLDRGFAMLDL